MFKHGERRLWQRQQDEIARLARDAAIAAASIKAEAVAVVDAEVGDITAQLALKANTADMDTALAGKADAGATTTALSLKADATNVAASLLLKADVAYVEAEFDAVDAALGGKADDADITALDGRVDTLEAALPAKLQWSAVPASAAATGVAGQIAYASGFLYVCVATDTWQRVAIATWP